MSNSPSPDQPLITGKRRRRETYDELLIKFDKLVVLHNNVVNQYNALRLNLLELQAEHRELVAEYNSLDERYQATRRQRALAEINFHGDSIPSSTADTSDTD